MTGLAKRLISKFFLIIILIVYLIVVVYLVFFNVGSTDREAYFTKREIHFTPFKTTIHSIQMAYDFYHGPKQTTYYWYLAIRNILGNILLFMPLGIIIPLLRNKFHNIKFAVLSAFFFSLTIETIQYLLVIGIADIDDILYNVLGASIGYYILGRFES